MYKLLLVDDEPIIREGLERIIDWEKLDLKLTASCPNAIAALDSMTDDMPDILLTDIRLPGMTGLELVQRAVTLHPMLQTLILSGHDTFQYAQQALKYGVIEYLLKPCSQKEMEEALLRACQAVDRQRKKVLYLYEERRQRIKSLVDSFNALRESEADAEQLEKQVGELVKTVEDPSLLQETLVAVVIGCMGAGQAEWGMNIITDALHDRRSLEELISRTLLRLRREGSAARSNDFVQQIISYTSVHYADESLSLQYLADKVVYMNADYIGREFTRAVGQKFSSYLLGIKNIPSSYYEAAIVDGAGPVRRFFSITLPLLTPIIFFNLINQVIGAFQAFNSSYLITKGKPLNTTLYYGVHLYNKAFNQFEMGYGSAMAWFMLLIIAFFTALIFRSSSAWVYYESEGR